MTRLQVIQKEDARLVVSRRGDDREVTVQPRRCFPWSAPGHYISLRDQDNREVAFIDDLAELDAQSREAIEAGLAETAFVLDIERVEAIDTEFEIRNWRVKTRQGPVTFQTRLDEWPRETPDQTLLLRDVAGNLYRFKDPGRMDENSRKLLWAFVD